MYLKILICSTCGVLLSSQGPIITTGHIVHHVTIIILMTQCDIDKAPTS
jgi:hypothetical protein